MKWQNTLTIGNPNKMKTIEIVTHCYAAELAHYAYCLDFQIASLRKSVLDSYPCRVQLAVCMWPEDRLTNVCLSYLPASDNLVVSTLAMSKEELGRRSIGRNLAALNTTADLVWFTDVDHVFTQECLERLAAMDWPAGASMIYPKTIQISRDHATGDQAIKQIAFHRYEINPNDFVPKHYSRAIGGVQIVTGDFARKYGYLDSYPEYQKPVVKPFGDFKDDIVYRKFCLTHGPIIGVDLPGIHRIRHSTTSYQQLRQNTHQVLPITT